MSLSTPLVKTRTTTTAFVDPFCSLVPSDIKLGIMGGEQGTEIQDEIRANAMTNSYDNRQHLAISLYEDAMHNLPIQLNCAAQIDLRSFDQDCSLAYHVDGWIDLNNDGRFEESENRVYYQSAVTKRLSRSASSLRVFLPAVGGRTMETQVHQMRLRLTPSAVYSVKCGDSDYSVTREYAVNIIPIYRYPGKTCSFF